MGEPIPQPRGTPLESVTDETLVQRIRAGERELFELLMRRHNRRVFRAARSIVRSDDEAEDVMQEAYVRAYEHLAQFSGEARFATWLTRIAIHEALARVRRQHRFTPVGEELEMPPDRELRSLSSVPPSASEEEQRLVHRDLIRLLERSVDTLPEQFRAVFVLREVEGMRTDEVAESLGIPEATVKTRLHRAREQLREAIAGQIEASASEAFSFHLSRCDRVVAAVMERIR